MAGSGTAGPRCVALAGPYGAGKTTLLESLLFVTGAIPRKGNAADGTLTGDMSDESRARGLSTELSVAETTYLGDVWSFIDCPGSVEFLQDARNGVLVADAVVVVCEPAIDRALALAPLLKDLDDRNIPHLLFINKMDSAEVAIRDLLAALQEVSARPLVLRQVPIRDGGAVKGYVDLVSERAYRYVPGKPSELVTIPPELAAREQEARTELLEHLADFDDALMEKLLEDAIPSTREIYDGLKKDLADDLIVPVLMGAGSLDHGVRRLLKLLRHEVPAPRHAAERLCIDADAAGPCLTVFKTLHLPHTGKLSFARLWNGELLDGATLETASGKAGRVGGLFRPLGARLDKISSAAAGAVVALGRLDDIATGDALAPRAADAQTAMGWPEVLAPVHALALAAEKAADEVKLSGAMHRLIDEDASLSWSNDPDTGETVLRGQGEIHLKVALDRLQNRYKVPVKAWKPAVPYRETLRKALSQHGRFKRQSGGHGQFGDVHLDIKPQPRGAGFAYDVAVVGGAVPRQYFGAVEAGVREYLQRGPLGFPVVDVAVTLTDGQYHSVDSSELAFKTAARMAMAEAAPKADPVLLEPVAKVVIHIPSSFTAKVQRVVSGRRGQILGYDARDGWKGWDRVEALMPMAEMQDLIVELRSATQGTGSFTAAFDHLRELMGKPADRIVEQRQAHLAEGGGR